MLAIRLNTEMTYENMKPCETVLDQRLKREVAMKAKIHQAPFVTTQLDLDQTLHNIRDNEMLDDNTNLRTRSDRKLPRWNRQTQSHPEMETKQIVQKYWITLHL